MECIASTPINIKSSHVRTNAHMLINANAPMPTHMFKPTRDGGADASTRPVGPRPARANPSSLPSGVISSPRQRHRCGTANQWPTGTAVKAGAARALESPARCASSPTSRCMARGIPQASPYLACRRAPRASPRHFRKAVIGTILPARSALGSVTLGTRQRMCSLSG